MLKNQFTLQDFMTQMQQIKKLGPLTQFMGMIPGFAQYAKEIPEDQTEKQFKRIEAIISSMTPDERREPDILNARRRQRIAKGSGTTVQDVNELMREFKQMQKMMQQWDAAAKAGAACRVFRAFPACNECISAAFSATRNLEITNLNIKTNRMTSCKSSCIQGDQPQAMATKIKLTRMGMKKQPTYRVVIQEERSKRDGKFIENIGRLRPAPKSAARPTQSRTCQLLAQSRRATPTDSVGRLLKMAGITDKYYKQRKQTNTPEDTTEHAE